MLNFGDILLKFIMGWNTSCSNKLFILVKCFNFWHHNFILPLLMSCPGVNDIPTIQIDHTSHSCPSCRDIITLQTTSVLFHPDIINRIYVCNWCTSTMVCLWSLIMIVLGEGGGVSFPWSSTILESYEAI